MCSSIPGENGFNKWVQERCGKPISLSYLNIRSWLTYAVDKTTAPHRERYIAYQSRQDGICLRCRCYCQLSSSLILLPSFCIMKIMKITPFRVLPRGGGAARCPTMWGCRCCHERRGGVSPDICKFIAQGTGQLFATASHRLDVAANIESIYRFFKKFRTFLRKSQQDQTEQ